VGLRDALGMALLLAAAFCSLQGSGFGSLSAEIFDGSSQASGR
jgi:hypothetical protein